MLAAHDEVFATTAKLMQRSLQLLLRLCERLALRHERAELLQVARRLVRMQHGENLRDEVFCWLIITPSGWWVLISEHNMYTYHIYKYRG